MSDGKVIQFPGMETPKNPLRVEEADPLIDSPIERKHGYEGMSQCADYHRKGVTLKDTNRRAYCSTCGEEIDLYDYVAKLAGDWAWVSRRYLDAREQAKRKETQLAELKRAEANTKNRIKTAQRRLAELDERIQARERVAARVEAL